MKVTLNINLPSTVKEDYNSTKNLSKKRELLSSQSCQKRGSYALHNNASSRSFCPVLLVKDVQDLLGIRCPETQVGQVNVRH